MVEQIKQPPIGLKPRWLVTVARLHEISAAIERYKEAGLPPNAEWYKEFFELHQWLLNYNATKQ